MPVTWVRIRAPSRHQSKGHCYLIALSLWHYTYSVLCVFWTVIWSRLKGILKTSNYKERTKRVWDTQGGPFLNPQRKKYNSALTFQYLVYRWFSSYSSAGFSYQIQESGLLISRTPCLLACLLLCEHRSWAAISSIDSREKACMWEDFRKSWWPNCTSICLADIIQTLLFFLLKQSGIPKE